jgi:hypothetical protein
LVVANASETWKNNQSEKITPTTKLFAGSQKQFTPTTTTTTTTKNKKQNRNKSNKKQNKTKQTNKQKAARVI